jgi:hypothetical protein
MARSGWQGNSVPVNLDQSFRLQPYAHRAGRPRHSLHLSLRLGTPTIRGRTRKLSRVPFGETRSGFSLVEFRRTVDSANEERKDLGLIEFCEPFKTIELWFDPQPDDQLLLIWLLDDFSSHPEIVAKLKLVFVDFELVEASPEQHERWKEPTVDIGNDELQTGSKAWQAYRAPTPEACFDLLSAELSALPLLRPALLSLLEELPSAVTGLGATEMRFLELIAAGYANTNALFHLRSLLQRRVFDEWEKGALLEALALGPTPAVAGVDEALRKLFYENYRARHEIYLRSRLSLTEFGWDVVAHRADFSRHNPIHRWWGGTELTSDRLWRWAPALMKP